MHIPQALYSSMRFVFLYADYYEFRKGWIYPQTPTPYCMLRYITEGSAMFEIGEQTIPVHAGDIVYIPEGYLLKCYSDDSLISFYSIRFINTLKLANTDFLLDFFSLPFVSKAVPESVYTYFKELYQSARSTRIDKLFRIRGYLELIIGELVGLANPEENETAASVDDYDTMSLSSIMEREFISNSRSQGVVNDPRIQIAVNYIIANPTVRFNESYLCKLAGLSQSSLRRLFKQQTGKSPLDFAKDLKMIAAARQLLMTNYPIATLSTELGFEDPNYFSRAFKKVFGVSPKHYRMTARTSGIEHPISKSALQRKGQLDDEASQ
ncbi:MAG: AraC family transcriptional regulator [Sphaerochaeta associata]|uniref:AraC family transcriptional regulator n=1 Tax=Sphaerochaeta associata TaxID=1129264 RepID=UPI002B21EA56|nr:AraC family transcriptional regulator [Sphaerochaeta associata]MEA5107930.1 AraC family transcriptional regulator [Sphaerochaeta associata]